MSKKAKTESKNPAIKILSGFVASVRIRCGKPNCRCARGLRHQAYYHVTYKSGTRVRKYVRRNRVAELREVCQVHRELQAQLRAGRAEYRKTLAMTREFARMLSSE